MPEICQTLLKANMVKKNNRSLPESLVSNVCVQTCESENKGKSYIIKWNWEKTTDSSFFH